MNCPTCNNEARRFGKDRKNNQRYQCLDCKKTFSEPQAKPLNEMRIPMDKALMALQLLVEGNSIRSTERITKLHRDTILALLVEVGERCEKMMEAMIQGISVKEVQLDEIWGFVGMKEK